MTHLLRCFRIPSLLLAGALQILPIVRAALPITQSAANVIAIIFRWGAGAAAALGGVQAVSGASTAITNPLGKNATNGQPFSLRLTTGPDTAHYWSATGLPAGLNLVGTSGSSLWTISGTPTVSGLFNVGLTAKDQSSSPASRTVTATLSLNILSSGSSGPSITTQPTNRTAVAGASTTFTVVATGSPTPVYQWYFGNALLANETNSTLTLGGVTTGQAGSYTVVVSNSVSVITSSPPAVLTVNVPPGISQSPANASITAGQAANFDVTATGTAPLKYFWRKGTSTVAVQTTPAYSIPIAQVSDAGSYSVIVSNMAGIATSAPATLAVAAAPQAPLITSQPISTTVVAGYSANFTVLAAGNPTPVYQWYFGNSLLANETNPTLTLNGVTTGQAGSYTVVVSNSVGVVTSSPPAILTVTPNPDTTKPVVTVASPAVAAMTVTSNWFRLSGTARDNAALYRVRIIRATKPMIDATGTSNWWAMVDLDPGTNQCQVVAFDMAGNVSLAVTKAIVFAVKSPLTLNIAGAGAVAGATNGQPLQVGRSYTLTATPKPGQVFSNWTGSIASSTNVLKFTMQSNLVINANFIPSPFIPVKGVYSGLFYETNEVRHGSSGFFTAAVAPSGVFSGSLQNGLKKYPLTGRFSVEGKSTNVVARAGTNSLTVELALALNGNDQITGRVTDGTWSAPVTADRAVFNALTHPAVTFSNRYTVILPGHHTNAANTPGGDGYGTVTVSRGGQLVFAGAFADGSKVTQSAPVSKAGQWPFYIPLYLGKGSSLGWVALTNTVSEDATGLLSWIRPAGPSTKYYTNGFAVDVSLTGSAYTAPGTNRLFQASNLTVDFAGGHLASPFTNTITLANGNKIVNTSSNKLALTITPANGLFLGSVTVPGSATARTFGGVILRKQGHGGGFFLSTNQSGSVRVGP